VDFLQPEVVELAQSRLPVVTIDHLMDSCATISSNNLGGMQKLTEYVVSRGHRRIAIIHGTPSSVTSARMAGFYRTLEAHGIDIPDHYVVESPYLDDELAYERTKELLALPERPTCIMYPDDYTCIGGMNAIREAGLRIPEDVSVTGYDGVQIARMMSPKITTLRQNMRLIGQMAADKVIELIEKPRTAMRSNRIIDGEIFEGESVAMINK
jgi:LacI family transcriptional regulator/LacI family purine nucleotide synthesis repressor